MAKESKKRRAPAPAETAVVSPAKAAKKSPASASSTSPATDPASQATDHASAATETPTKPSSSPAPLQVTACKFFSPTPLGIEGLAVSPDSQLLAVGRANGVVEISLGAPHWQKRNVVYLPSKKSNCRCLVWVPEQDNTPSTTDDSSSSSDDSDEDEVDSAEAKPKSVERQPANDKDTTRFTLVVSGIHGEITGLDPDTGACRWSVSSGGGAVWSLSRGKEGRLFAACDDGTLKIFERDDYDLGGGFALRKTLNKTSKAARVGNYGRKLLGKVLAGVYCCSGQSNQCGIVV